jgi:hypothetical protein
MFVLETLESYAHSLIQSTNTSLLLVEDLLAANNFFCIFPKKFPTPLVSLMTNHRRIVLLDIVFIFATSAMLVSIQFAQLKV